MSEYLRTLALLESFGVPVQSLGRGTVDYFINVEHKTAEQVVTILLGKRECVLKQKES